MFLYLLWFSARKIHRNTWFNQFNSIKSQSWTDVDLITTLLSYCYNTRPLPGRWKLLPTPSTVRRLPSPIRGRVPWRKGNSSSRSGGCSSAGIPTSRAEAQRPRASSPASGRASSDTTGAVPRCSCAPPGPCSSPTPAKRILRS